MRVLLDHDVPHDLRLKFPKECEVVTAHYQGWEDYDDDRLLSEAEEKFDVFITLDTNLAHQQNVRSRQIGIVVIDVHPIISSHLEKHMGKVKSALSIAAEEHRTLVVQEDGIDVLPR
jgi:predicted nuclease of predicted toxin-antitoxin system